MQQLEKIIVNPEDMEILDDFKNEIDAQLKIFCEENGIQDFTKESQNRWNACLMFINNKVFKGTDKLKLKGKMDGYSNPNYYLNNSNCNAYDMDIVNNVCNYYIYVCYLYDKEISVLGFSKLTGISFRTLYGWGKKEAELSTTAFQIAENLYAEREESLSAKLLSAKNPIAILASLNHHYGWASGPSQQPESREKITAAEIRKKISDNQAAAGD